MQPGIIIVCHSPVEIQAILAAIQRHMRLLLHFHIQRGDFLTGNVRRIAYDHMKASQRLRRNCLGIQQCGQCAAGKVMLHQIPLCHLQRGFRQISQHRIDALHILQHRNGQTSAAAAQIQHPAFAAAFQQSDRRLRQSFGICPRDQGVLGHFQGNAVKLPPSGDMLQGCAAESLCFQRINASLHIVKHPQVLFHKEFLRLDVHGITHQFSGFDLISGNALLPQFPPQIQVSLIHSSYHYQRSSFSFSGITLCSARIATSSMLSSGSAVVNRCSIMPGARNALVNPLSWRPTKRLNS